MSPCRVMELAEKLHHAGYISCPYTMSTGYPPNFDFLGLLQPHANHLNWGKTVQWILKNKIVPPAHAEDAGDHPPMVPTKVPTPCCPCQYPCFPDCPHWPCRTCCPSLKSEGMLSLASFPVSLILYYWASLARGALGLLAG